MRTVLPVIGFRCAIVRDGRERSTSHFKNISTADLNSWLAQAIVSKYGQAVSVYFETDAGLDAELPPNCITLVVHKAYVKHMATSISGVVVLSSKSKLISRQIHRGQAGGLNWFGADSEYTSMLNKALNLALEDLTAFIVSQ